MSPSDPASPPAPTKLRVANMSFGPSRSVAARIEWSVPLDLDVPIHHYKVGWSWTAVGHSSASSLTKRRKTVVRVRMLQLNTSHFPPHLHFLMNEVCVHRARFSWTA